jgi:hypothetical protein
MDAAHRTTWEAAGLYDPDAPDAAERLELLEYLTSVGCSIEELVANRDGLFWVASRRILFGDAPRVSVAQIAELSGVDEALVRRVRLAAGLPDPGDAPECSQLEVDVMTSFAFGAAVLGEEVTLQFTRVIGAAAAGLAEAALATFAVNRSLPMLEEGGTPVPRPPRRSSEFRRCSTCCCASTSTPRAMTASPPAIVCRRSESRSRSLTLSGRRR